MHPPNALAAAPNHVADEREKVVRRLLAYAVLNGERIERTGAYRLRKSPEHVLYDPDRTRVNLNCLQPVVCNRVSGHKCVATILKPDKAVCGVYSIVGRVCAQVWI